MSRPGGVDLLREDEQLKVELQAKRLICEVQFTEDRIESLRSRVLEDSGSAWLTPHVAAVVTVGVGVYFYESGDYWDALPELVSPGERTKWGKAFERFLEAHATLESFQFLIDEGAHRYVARILAHGGLPLSCMDDLFTLLIRNGSPEQSSREVLDYLADNPRLLTAATRPTERFVTHGGEAAEDLVSRLLALWLAQEKGERHGGFGLPTRIVEAFTRWYCDAAHSIRRASQRFPSPVIVLDPRLMTVTMQLPACADHPDAGNSWRALGRTWPSDRASELPIQPAPRWEASCGRRVFEFRGLPERSPIVFFEPPTGRLVRDPAKRRLPAQVWALFRSGLKTSPPPVHAEEFRPWNGHQIAAFDLEGHSSLAVADMVFEVRRPFFHLGAEPRVGQVQGVGGVPVYDRPPDAGWEGNANLSLVKDGVHQGNIDILCSELATLTEDPGEYEIQLRGPLGQNLNLHFVLIPGLSVRAEPPLMWPSTRLVTWDASAPGAVIRCGGEVGGVFSSRRESVELQVSFEGRTFELVAEVPRLEWRLNFEHAEAGSGWSVKPMLIRVADLEANAAPMLVCRLPLDPTEARLSLEGRRSGNSFSERSVSVLGEWFRRFDLALVRDMLLASGEPERFDLVVRGREHHERFRGLVIDARPEWDISRLRAAWTKEEGSHCVQVSWDERGAAVAGRWLTAQALWRPGDGLVLRHELTSSESGSYDWRVPLGQLRLGRYLIRAIHAPWGLGDTSSCESQEECFVDVYPEAWPNAFSCEDSEISVDAYLEGLLAHWYRPERVRQPPPVPRDLAPDQILRFLEGIASIHGIETVRVPRDGSGALNIFCVNPEATAMAVGDREELPPLWERVLPSLDIITTTLSEYDREFVFNLVLNWVNLESAAKAVRREHRPSSLCPPLRRWHRDLRSTRRKGPQRPRVDDLIFLCERFAVLEGHSAQARHVYEALRADCQSREAV